MLSTGGEWDTPQTDTSGTADSELTFRLAEPARWVHRIALISGSVLYRTAQCPGKASSLTLESNRTEVTSKFHPFTGCVTLTIL